MDGIANGLHNQWFHLSVVQFDTLHYAGMAMVGKVLRLGHLKELFCVLSPVHECVLLGRSRAWKPQHKQCCRARLPAWCVLGYHTMFFQPC